VDFLILADIYAAREKFTGDISSKCWRKPLPEKGQNCTYISDFSLITDYVREHSKPGDLIITMGAGNIYEVGNALLK
jgi:UDP-N-acetylmuramate--alanine ligase